MEGGCSLEVSRAGDYSLHQCGLSFTAQPHHTGVWVYELERYHTGFHRRYGELRYGEVTVTVSRETRDMETSTLSTTNTTTSSSSITTTSTMSNTASEVEIDVATHAGIRMPVNRTKEDEEVYQRNFLILKVRVEERQAWADWL